MKNNNKIFFIILNTISQLLSFFLIWMMSNGLTVESFSIFGKVVSTIALITSLTTLNSNILIQVKPDDTVTYSNIYARKIVITNSAILLTLLILYYGFFHLKPADGINLLVFCFAFLSIGFSTIYGSNLTRSRHFTGLGLMKLNQVVISSIFVIVSMSLFLDNDYIAGIIIFSYYLGYFMSSIIFIYKIKGEVNDNIIKYVLSEREFCFNSVFNSLINSASIHGVTLLIYFTFDENYAAAFFLFSRIIGGPVSLLSTVLSQIYTGDIGKLVREGKIGLINQVCRRYLLLSSVVGIAGFGTLYFLLNEFFLTFFSEDWLFAQKLILPTTIYFLTRFTFIPVMQTLNILSKVNIMTIWEFTRLFLLSTLFLFAKIYDVSIYTFVYFLTITVLSSYLIFVFLVERNTRA
ncbi:hypothetical protein [Vibrio breoganii]|uniref:hypothetical protein n=1 Tax=Vibrio breoganii TaxID=553239 RepID=UPI000C82C461|nr:hypothetical protein [Vibrio breoganii]PMG94224.1 hypothetical protein BCU79_12090 [Vibrio breoganii]PMI16113.1 hypothetical protein BCU49_02090 [Vibrio breoganii]TKF85993.1 hypothetical protein FCV82_15865 [Vibrio breoganii]